MPDHPPCVALHANFGILVVQPPGPAQNVRQNMIVGQQQEALEIDHLKDEFVEERGNWQRLWAIPDAWPSVPRRSPKMGFGRSGCWVIDAG